MTKQDKSVHKKSMGRPPGIRYGGTIPARFEITTMKALDAWAEKHDVSRSEAIRRLVELGLTVKTRARQSSEGQRLRAKEMAGKTIDKMADTDASPNDQASRKKRLLKGPEEFQGVRKDRSK